MTTAEDTIAASDLRNSLSQVLDACAQRGKVYRVLRNSKESVMIVGAAEWQMLNETLEVLMDRDLMKQLSHWQKNLKEQEARPADEVFEEIERELDAEEHDES